MVVFPWTICEMHGRCVFVSVVDWRWFKQPLQWLYKVFRLCVLQDDYLLRKSYHNGYIEIISPQCEPSDLLQEPYIARKSYHNGCIQMFSHQYEFSFSQSWNFKKIIILWTAFGGVRRYVAWFVLIFLFLTQNVNLYNQ